VRSGLLPTDKLTAIGGLVGTRVTGRRPWGVRRTVLMCGDGVNDAPALARADVSVAMGEGAALAMETSDVTLMDSNLEKLVLAVTMGRRVLRTILENVTFALLVKALVLWYTLAGRSSLWAAIASDVGAMLVVTLNGMKLLPRSSQKVDVAAREEV
jgi:Cd2+/Zn2+-exporting ATPase